MGTNAARTREIRPTAKVVNDQEGPPPRKKRRMTVRPSGPKEGEAASEATPSWKSTWSDDPVAPITSTRIRQNAQPPPPPPPTQLSKTLPHMWGPGTIENIDEVTLFGEGLDASKFGNDLSGEQRMFKWYDEAEVSKRHFNPCQFNKDLDVGVMC